MGHTVDSSNAPDDELTHVTQAVLASSMNPEERAVVALWLQGEGRTGPLASAWHRSLAC
jgi:hypothetical protein